MLRYLVCFVVCAGVWLFFAWPAPMDYAAQHAEASARLAEVRAAPVREIERARFHYKSVRSSPGRLQWRWGDPEQSAVCIRCPVSLQKIAPQVRTLSYVRRRSGEQVIVELRGEGGAVILSRPVVMATLEDIVRRTNAKRADAAGQDADKAVAVFLSLVVGAVSCLGYAVIRLRERRWAERERRWADAG